MKRVLLIANKNWEVEPILNAMLNYKISSLQSLQPTLLNYPWKYPQGTAVPRAVWDNFPNVTIELWCVQDLMDAKWNSSSSEGKKTDLPQAIQYRTEKPDLIIACGTAGFGIEGENNNGCVVIGSNVFIHNFHPNSENPNSKWDDPENFEKLLPSTVSKSFFDLFDTATTQAIEQKLLKPFLNPSKVVRVIAAKDLLALSTVNITNYADYTTSDQVGLKAIADASVSLTVGSVETTHGIIRLLSDAPFVFISGITDRAGHFDEDVNGTDAKGNKKTEAQNYTASFNIGACLGTLLPSIATYATQN